MTDSPAHSLTAERLKTGAEQIERAQQHIEELSRGDRVWRLRVPAYDDDSDIVIGKALQFARDLLADATARSTEGEANASRGTEAQRPDRGGPRHGRAVDADSDGRAEVVADATARAQEIGKRDAEIDVLRGRYCLVDGDGPCGVCVKCLRLRAEEAEAENASLRQQLALAKQDHELVKGAMAAQDEREQQAGEKCGVSWLEHGCDWPDAVAGRLIHVRQQLAHVQQERDTLAHTIVGAAIECGITKGERPLTGPEVLLLLGELATRHREAQTLREALPLVLNAARLHHADNRVWADVHGTAYFESNLKRAENRSKLRIAITELDALLRATERPKE